jgi:hypothetical protein
MFGFSQSEKDKLAEHFLRNRHLVPNKLVQHPFVLDSMGVSAVCGYQERSLMVWNILGAMGAIHTQTRSFDSGENST